MSEDIRKQLRTQGRYSDKLLSSDDRNKGRDRKQKVSPTTKVSPESRVPKRNSTENRGTKSSFTNESMSLKYEEQSDYKFSQLNDVKKAEQIDGCGKRDLSVTENGTSTIIYEPKFLHKDEGWGYFDRLRGSTKWHTKNIVIQGVEYPQPRLVAWYGPFPYTYSGATLEPAEMPSAVLEIKEKVESFLKTYNIDASFNSVLLNLYRNGKDSVAWHSDDELTMGISPTIASVSLGETRRFEMRQKMPYDENGSPSDQTANYVVKLAHGSLIVMTGCMQDDWQHRVPKEYHDKEERINLTFRTVYPLEKIPQHVPAREIKKESSVCYSSKTSHHGKLSLDPVDFPPLNSNPSPISANPKPNAHERTNFNSKKGNINTSVECWDDELIEVGKDSEPFDDNKAAQNSVREEQPINVWLKSSAPLSANSLQDDDCKHAEKPQSPERISGTYIPANSIKDGVCEEKSPPGLKSNMCVSENSVQDEDYISEEKSHSSFCYDEPSLSENGACDNSTDSNHVEDSLPSNNNQQNNLDKMNAEKPWLNVNAEEFVPLSTVPYYDYSLFDLSYLISYDQESITKMDMRELQAFSDALKAQVLENSCEFNRFVREELDFLCNITDGNQTLKNQKLISLRIMKQVNSYFERTSSQRSFDRSSRQRAPYGNQSYHSDRGRKYSNQGRNNNHRYN